MTFAEHFPAEAAGIKITRSAPEALAALPYRDETAIKNRALTEFLAPVTPCRPRPLIPAPESRFYRTTGKRRISCRNGKVQLHFGRTPGREDVAPSQLEPAAHMTIYRVVQQVLSRPRSRAAAAATNYCIIRGAGNDRTLILNVRQLSGDIVRTMRMTAETVQKEEPSVRSAFLYLDPTGSDYYFEAERPAGELNWKKLFGPERLSLRIAAPEPQKFLYPPTVFSQINESILPAFADQLVRLLKPQPADQLLDLYCGYGLWSLLLAPRLQSVWGAEWSADAVRAARANAAYHLPDHPVRFETGAIDTAFLNRLGPPPRHQQELILLDPPRHGTAPGVLENLIARRPRRIAHVFCGVDEIPAALRIYRHNGCQVEILQPFDFFPGTMNLEVLALIRPPGSRN